MIFLGFAKVAKPMDADVILAMAKWPNVPPAWGWLRLDRRGQWFLVKRDADDFIESRDGLGSIVRNERMIDYIGRNYASDERGRWYFQNGPQRAYADLELAPWVLRIDISAERLHWLTHTGVFAQQTLAAATDAIGNFYVLTELGLGLVDDRHLARLEHRLTTQDDQLLLHLPRKNSEDKQTLVVQAYNDIAKQFNYTLRPRFGDL